MNLARRADSGTATGNARPAGGHEGRDPPAQSVSGSGTEFTAPAATASSAARAGAAGTRRARRRRPGTAARLAAFHAVVLAVVLGVVVAALVRNFTSSYEAIASRGLSAELNNFQKAALGRGDQQNLYRFTVQYLSYRPLPSGDVIIVALNGQLPLGSVGARGVSASPAVHQLLADPPATTVSQVVQIGGAPTELVAAPLYEGTRRVGTFLATSDLTPLVSQRRRVLELSISEAAVALVAGVASAFLLLRRLLRTVGRITTTAEEIGEGDLDRRLGDQGTDDEVGQLATTFDSMLDRIDNAMTVQRRLLSDVSHQLRTPLTVARGHLEVMERTDLGDEQAARETIALVLDELEHMRALTERLLLLGQAMEPDFLAPEPIDLRSFLADLYDAVRVLAPRELDLAPVPDVVLVADPAKLRGALLNLVDNAVKATAPGDSIGVSAMVVPATGQLALTVDDSGPGIPAAERSAVLARFARPGARNADGSGLGLAIVKAVAEAHGGEITIGDSPRGGCRIAIVLPPSCVTVGTEV